MDVRKFILPTDANGEAEPATRQEKHLSNHLSLTAARAGSNIYSIASNNRTEELTISVTRVAKTLALIVAFLTLLSLAGQVTRFYLGHWNLMGLVPLTDFDGDSNMPAWFKSSMFLIGSILLTAITVIEKRKGARYVPHWQGLLVVFLILSFDSIAEYHQVIGAALKARFFSEGFLSHLRVAWVVPATIIVALFVPTYVRFLLYLPRRIGILFTLGGAFYAAGGIVFHSLSASFAYANQIDFSMKLSLLHTIEEVSKMIGIVIFTYALLSYLASYVKDLKIHFVE